MAKSTKRKKEKKSDFVKPKLKVGKGKKPATNAVDTTFKARSIVLPEQSITIERNSTVPTTKRKLTLEDLLGHLKHHNTNVRKDALLGLRELLSGYPELVTLNLAHILRASSRLIVDEDAGVRKSLLNFLSWLLPSIQKTDLIPHTPLLLLFTSSAQSHMFPEVRTDAVRCLDILLEVIPDLVVDGWAEQPDSHGRRILNGYLSLLNSGTRLGKDGDSLGSISTPGVILSSASKSVVLNSFATFLQHATSSSNESENIASSSSSSSAWFLESSFPSPEAFKTFLALLSTSRGDDTVQKNTVIWTSDSDKRDEDFMGLFNLISFDGSIQHSMSVSFDTRNSHLSDHEFSKDAEEFDSTQLLPRLCSALHPILLSVFLDCAPDAFAPGVSPSESGLKSVASIARISRSLYKKALSLNMMAQTKTLLHESLQQILNHLIKYFPYGEHVPAHQAVVKIEVYFEELNSTLCELVSLLVLNQMSSHVTEPTQQLNPHLLRLLSLVREYIVFFLKGEMKTDLYPMGKPISPAMYNALLPSFWCLLLHESLSDTTVLDAILNHSKRVSSTSVVKRLSIEFLSRIILLQSDPRYKGRTVGNNQREVELIADWLLHLPKVLWEIADSEPSSAEIILLLLLRLIQRKSKIIDRGIRLALRTRFTPFFCVQHKTKGEILGPYAKLRTRRRLRHLVLDLLSMLLHEDGPDEVLDSFVGKAALAMGDLEYWDALVSQTRSCNI